MKIEFDIKKNERGYIVIRKNGLYENHAHIKTLDVCKTLIKLIDNNRLPKSEYLQESCRRLLTEEEFLRLKQKKQYYFNVNKGIRKR